MLERDKIIGLYEIYKNLLTDKQRDYFENYYYEDLSLSEIAENFIVSKTIVSKTLKQVESKLTELEETLGLNKIYDDLVNLKNNININDKIKIEKIIEDNFKIWYYLSSRVEKLLTIREVKMKKNFFIIFFVVLVGLSSVSLIISKNKKQDIDSKNV